MKKSLKIVGFVVLVLILLLIVVGLTQPKDLTVVRSTTIKAPKEVVFNQVKIFKNWVNWSPWLSKEPSAKVYYIGIDGQNGSAYHWKGDELGEGEMTATKIAADKLAYELHFIKPWEGNADGNIAVEDLGNGQTKVTWTMVNYGHFPFNALNFIMDKFIGADFEDGLKLLKTYSEAHPNMPLSESDIIEKDFPATVYASIRKKIPFSEIQSFSEESYTQLANIIKDRMQGVASCIYYDWDDKNGLADMAPAFPVSGTAPFPELQMVQIPAGKSCQLQLKGPYGAMTKAHEMMGQFIAQKGINLSYVLEEYLSGPANEADSNKWLTNIIYVYK